MMLECHCTYLLVNMTYRPYVDTTEVVDFWPLGRSKPNLVGVSIARYVCMKNLMSPNPVLTKSIVNHLDNIL